MPVYSAPPGTPVVDIARGALAEARQTGRDVVILDTAGRLQVDEALMAEIRDLAEAVQPTETLLVVDAMVGQEAVAVAEAFQAAAPVTGLVLTKIDGDARGGAALSISAVSGVAVKFMGTGEKTDALEVFHPDRLAGRILGMGDVVSLVERAQETYDTKEAERLAEKLRKNAFTLDDFLEQMQQVKKMGPLGSLDGDDPRLRRGRQAGAGGHRSRGAGPRRGHHPLHDARRAQRPRHPQRLPAPPHRARLRHEPPGGQPPGEAVRRDAAGHEADARAGGPAAGTAHGTTVADDLGAAGETMRAS